MRFIGYLCRDLWKWFKNRKKREFREYGITCYSGRQGAGKTISMVAYLTWVKRVYPDCLIFTNFFWAGQDGEMSSWRDMLDIRNGTRGVVFAIDEIHSEFSTNAWRDFPDNLLAEVSQQRKQRVKIVCTSQLFLRLVKQLREQCYEVVECRTLLGRLTTNIAYDALDYERYYASEMVKVMPKIKSIWKVRFVQTDELRRSYDTYRKIVRMRKADFSEIKTREKVAGAN